MDRGAWQATVHGVTESDTTEQLTLSHTSFEKKNSGRQQQLSHISQLTFLKVLSCTLPHFFLESILQGTVTKPNLGPFAQSTANQSTDSGL